MDKSSIQKIIKEKVIGKIVPKHDDHGHHYQFVDSGIIVDSVTTKIIIEQYHLRKYAAYEALRWMENRWPMLTKDNKSEYFKAASLAHEDNRDQAGGIGTQAHNTIEEYCNDWIFWNEKPSDIRKYVKNGYDAKAIASARAAERTFTNNKAFPIASELLVGSADKGFAGTLDMLVMTEEFLGFPDIELWDWKTSNNVSEKFPLQISAYRYLFEEMTGIKIKKSKIMHLSKSNDEFDEYIIPNEREAYAAFKGICKAYDWKANGKEKLIKVINKNKWKNMQS